MKINRDMKIFIVVMILVTLGYKSVGAFKVTVGSRSISWGEVLDNVPEIMMVSLILSIVMSYAIKKDES